MFYLDNIIMLQTLGFSLAHKIPFSVYGENFMMCLQNAIVILQMWKYNKDIDLKQKIAVATVYAGYLLMIAKNALVPEAFWSTMLVANTFLNMVSKFP